MEVTMLNQTLEQLTPIELLLLQKHVKKGKEHLKKWLSNQEVSELFQLGKIDSESKKAVDADKTEFLGSITAVLNTVLTATLGAWMGVSAFTGFHTNSASFFYGILSSCIALGAFVGYENYKMTKNTAKEAVEKERIKTVELNILTELNHKRSVEIREKIRELDQMLTEMNIKGIEAVERPSNELNDHEVCLNWLNQADKVVRELDEKGPFSLLFTTELDQARFLLLAALAEDQGKNKQAATQILTKLADASYQPRVDMGWWITSNFRSIVLSLIPTLFGVFSSLFVYLEGAPKLAQQMGQYDLYFYLNRVDVKEMELKGAIAITIYFCLAALYNNWKAFKRDQELSNMDTLLTREETKLELQDDKFLKLKRIDAVIKPLYRLYTSLKKITVAV